ncbi:MAG: bifunctional diguanylate cyclase/phosphodiesterase [Saccharofermentans sp.]|nr:bifunctional diguanylate cyclase/phosphodiesterase [Saccharofermentans sp.]
MTKQAENNRVDRTLQKLQNKREAPKSAFILLLLLFVIANAATATMANTHGEFNMFGAPVDYSAMAGVFSMLGNICLICIALLFGKTGFITAFLLIVVQFPGLVLNIFVRHNYASIPGLFSNLLIALAITIIHIGNRKITAYQAGIRKQAVTDRLTGLPNRFACGELLQDYLKRFERFAVITVDLNNFKNINDTMGHDTGDKVLCEIASRFKALANSMTTGTRDFVARSTADEFVIVLHDGDTPAAVERTIDAYRSELERKITLDDCDYYTTACFGYAMFPDHTDKIETLLTYADAAVHEAKRHGAGSRVVQFNSDFLASNNSLEIERKIRSALTNDQILCNLQPQYDMEHHLRGFEVLARMKDSNGNYISPVDFIPVAERTGLVDRIDMRMFEMSVEFLDKVLKETGKRITLSSNISVRHLMKNNIIEQIRKVLDRYDVPPELIELEITESIMIDSPEKAMQRIDELREIGLKIAIDDFGTGYSSLSYLNNFPANLLKIDKSFIDNMNLNDSSRQYVAMIISIGHTLDLEVISEGVEAKDQVDALKDIGCDYIQGFVWGKPLPLDKAYELVSSSV